MSAFTLVYSTRSAVVSQEMSSEDVSYLVSIGVFKEEDEAHCFVCGRHTDHFAEHDDLVEQGLARYGSDGSVYRV